MRSSAIKILVINPHIRDGLSRTPGVRRYFPWGLATVMRRLEDDGHEISLLDVYGKDMLQHEIKRYLDDHSFECVCIGSFASMNYSHVLWLANAVKERYSIPVVVGGLLADLHFNFLLLKKTVDFCVIGEGEDTAVDLLRNLNSPDRVKGLAYLRDGEIVTTPQRELIKDLDTLPMPNFDMWDMSIYLGKNLWADDETTSYEEFGVNLPSPDLLTPNISMFSGRGCPFKCRFCSRSYQTVRYKSVDRIIEEIVFLKKRFGVRAVHFYDEILVFKKEHVLELCRRIKDMGVYWDGQARVNTVNRDILRQMRDANCYSIGLGLESGSDRILRAMNKGITRDQIISVLNAAKDAGMHLKLQFMCGYPGETAQDLDKTISLVKESGYPPRRMSWTTPLPGSQIYEDAKRSGLIPDEEAYLHALRLGMNKPGRILLNISGLPDREMTRLYVLAHYRMELNYLLTLAKKPANYSKRFFWVRIGELFTNVARGLQRGLMSRFRM